MLYNHIRLPSKCFTSVCRTFEAARPDLPTNRSSVWRFATQFAVETSPGNNQKFKVRKTSFFVKFRPPKFSIIFWTFWVNFWELSLFLVSSESYFGAILRLFEGHFLTKLGWFLGHFSSVYESFLIHFLAITRSFWGHFSAILTPL